MKIFRQPISFYMPIFFALVVSMLLICLAVWQESQVQGSVLLPGDFPFKAYIPGRYAVYLDMDVLTSNADKHLANMRAVPFVKLEIRGAGHLNVLYPPVWQCGGLSRYTTAPDGAKRILVPFAEFEILWPGNYEIKAIFSGAGTKNFLVSVGPTSLLATSLILTIIILFTTFSIFYSNSSKKTKEKTRKAKTSFEDG